LRQAGASRPSRSRSERRRSLLVWLCGLAALFGFVVLGAGNIVPVERLTPLVFDAYQRLAPRAEAGAPITVVDIDEASIAELGQWPWSRTVIARMVDRLGELGAAAIAFDVVFPEPDRTSLAQVAHDLERAGATVTFPGEVPADNDLVLAAAFARNPVIAGIVISNETAAALPPGKAGFSFGGTDPRAYLAPFTGGVTNLPPLTEAAQGMGFFSFPPSADGVVRAIPLVAAAQGNLYPTLGVEALRLAQGARSVTVRSTDASGEISGGSLGMTALRVGDFEVPSGAGGEFWVYFSGLPSLTTVPAAALLDPARSAAVAERIAGHIVLVGTSAVGLRDLVPTPTDASVPGVRVHAEIIDQILGATFLTRPDWAPGAEIAGALLLGLLLVVAAQRGGAVVTAASLLLLGAVAVLASWFAFTEARLLLDPILPLGAVLAVFAVTMPLLLLLTDREKQFVRGAFGRYLSPTLVERLADNPEALKLGGEIRDLSVMFTDIRGFTTLSENLAPDELTGLLNGFLTPMTDVLLRRDATIDKYMGDAIMAFWNAPLDIPDHRRRACLAALEMLDVLGQLNRDRGLGLRMGIGLNAGEALVGNLGSAQRFSYSAIGDTVNLASRVEGLNKAYGLTILVTGAVRDGAPDLAFVEVDLVRVVGRAEPVPVFTLLGDAAHAQTATFRALAEPHGRMIAAYRAADPDTAGRALADARHAAPPEFAKLYELYAERLADMRDAPPPAGWDGVFTAREK
jgi:adenylate cyclase